jgi:hypothetical protein
LDKRISSSIDPDELFIEQDKIILMAAGLTETECSIIHQAWVHIRSRRQRLLSEISA